MCRGIGSHFHPSGKFEFPLSQTSILVNQWVVNRNFFQKPIFAKNVTNSGQIFDFW